MKARAVGQHAGYPARFSADWLGTARLTAGANAFIGKKADPPERLLQGLRGLVESHAGGAGHLGR